MTLEETLAEIEAAIDSIETWTTMRDMELHQHGARAWKAESSSGWNLLIAAWPAETDMHSAGGGAITTRWGFDGTASRGGTVVRLPRELAERAAKRAR